MKSISILPVLLLASPAIADTVVVFPNQSIQAAIDMAQNGDVICLVDSSASYQENIDFGDKQITIRGASTTFAGGSRLAGAPGNSGPVVSFGISSGANVPNQVLENVSIRGFNMQGQNRGIDITDTSPTIRDVSIRSFRSDFGAALRISGGDPIIEDSEIIGNHSNVASPGLVRGGAVYIESGSPLFTNCDLSSNSASVSPVNMGSFGGAVFLEEPGARFDRCVFEYNTAKGDGGAVCLANNSPALPLSLEFDQCRFFGNQALNGGALSIRNNNTLLVESSTFIGNIADGTPFNAHVGVGPSRGGAISLGAVDCTLISSEFHSNRAGNSTVNNAVGSGGAIGVVGLIGSTDLRVENCTIAQNEAASNGSVSGRGGGIFGEFVVIDVVNTILWSNLAGPGLGPQIAKHPVLSLTMLNIIDSNIEGGTADISGGPPTTAFGVLDEDPLFVTTSASTLDGLDFSVQGASTMIDAASVNFVPAAGALDVEGNVRLLGTAVDLGAHEFVNCMVLTNYGPLTPIPGGPGAVMSATGSTSASANDLTLRVTGALPNVFGQFIYGYSQGQTTLGNGNLLIGNGVARLSIVQTNPAGTASFLFDNGTAAFPFSAGFSVNFQFLFREGTTFNLSDGLNVIYCN